MERYNVKKIPKTFHAYWGTPNKTMPYLRYLTLVTAKLHNPDYKIVLHMSRASHGEASSSEVLSIERTNFLNEAIRITDEVRYHDFDEYGFPTAANKPLLETFKSDFLRWKLLAEEGGVWSDMDIIYQRPISCLEFTRLSDDIDNLDAALHLYGTPYHSFAIGFLLSSGNENPFFRTVYEASKNIRLESLQAIGADFLNATYKNYVGIRKAFPNLVVADVSARSIYPVLPIPAHVKYALTTPDPIIPTKTVGFHWFGGSPHAKTIESQLINEESIPNTGFGNFIRKALQRTR